MSTLSALAFGAMPATEADARLLQAVSDDADSAVIARRYFGPRFRSWDRLTRYGSVVEKPFVNRSARADRLIGSR